MTFDDLTFLIFVKVDNEERAGNLITVINYYRSVGNAKFVIVEEDGTSKVPDIIGFNDNDTYVFCRKSVGEWNKCEGYNKCIKLAKTNILVFNDVDVIIHPTQLLAAAKILDSNPSAGMVYPYNGQFLCTNKQIKEQFSKTLDYNDLEKYYPRIMKVNYDDGNILIGHTNSRGGCVMGRRDNIIKCNGYNPLFEGWGYEDDEMPTRVHKLGYDVSRINGERQPCWHLHHFDGTGSRKETQPNYEDNRQIASKVDHADKAELEEFIQQWEL